MFDVFLHKKTKKNQNFTHKIKTMLKRLFTIGFFLLINYFAFSAENSLVESPFMDTMAYNFFSPNGDSLNQTFIVSIPQQNFEIDTIDRNLQKTALYVFNRWGDLVYKSSPYKNDWAGLCNQPNQLMGKEVPEGIYFYRFEYTIAEKEYKIEGKIVLKR
jgi:gliding motility-associated-like protein